jgi:lipoprotein-anchoring transpeptidase ErfK/SrfK
MRMYFDTSELEGSFTVSTRRNPRSNNGFIRPSWLLHAFIAAVAIAAALVQASIAEASGVRSPDHLQQAPKTSKPDAKPSVEAAMSPVLIPPVPPTRYWFGTAGQDAHLRATPDRSRKPVGELKAGQVVQVRDWVVGEEVQQQNTTWAQLSTGQYVYSSVLRRAPVGGPTSLPADAPASGRWIDVNLFEQVATAYEGRTPMRTVPISAGRPGWDTPQGTFSVLRRVENETMDGSTLIGQGPNGKGADYKIENVRHTQYFTQDGAAIHSNYWRSPALFGMPGSHGCIGMLPADAAWFWNFAIVGTPIVIHE